jgi:hypothetical protein
MGGEINHRLHRFHRFFGVGVLAEDAMGRMKRFNSDRLFLNIGVLITLALAPSRHPLNGEDYAFGAGLNWCGDRR